jgi:predicted AAA+ superfamily ATPase
MVIREIVLQHKAERELFILQAEKYVLRESIPYIQKFLDENIIKVISGPRRAGKSVFCILLLKNKNFAYLNFDDENLLKIKNYDEIIKALYEVYPDAKYFLFDEIQNLDKWELFVNKLHRRNFNLIITGSNSKLLEKEISSVLTGRYISVKVLPFSFREFLKAKNFELDKEKLHLPEIKGKILNLLSEYIFSGGFPEVVVKNLDAKIYLETLFDAILLKDVVKRYKVRFVPQIYDLAIYLLSNFSSEFSFTKIKNILGLKSVTTTQNYVRYLEESYLLFMLNRFSFKLKEQIKAPKKIYTVDNGFVLAKTFQLSVNIGKLMENAVFCELLRRNFRPNLDLFYYKAKNGKEVDFVVKQGPKAEKLIQVCYNTSDPKTKEREIKALSDASDELNCKDLEIISWDYEAEEKYKGKIIKFIPLWKWLLEKYD